MPTVSAEQPAKTESTPGRPIVKAQTAAATEPRSSAERIMARETWRYPAFEKHPWWHFTVSTDFDPRPELRSFS